MECITTKLQEMGASIVEYDDAIRVISNGELHGTAVKTRPYPGFPTDMQAQIGVCMALARGTSRLIETVYETRFFGYTSELTKMGANIDIKTESKMAIFEGVDRLHGADVTAKDLRAGAALVIAGLTADGITRVDNIHFVERGYQNLIEKMTALGADIKKIEE